MKNTSRTELIENFIKKTNCLKASFVKCAKLVKAH